MAAPGRNEDERMHKCSRPEAVILISIAGLTFTYAIISADANPFAGYFIFGFTLLVGVVERVFDL